MARRKAMRVKLGKVVAVRISTWAGGLGSSGVEYYWTDGKNQGNFDVRLTGLFHGGKTFQIQVKKGHPYPPSELVEALRKKLG